MVECFRGLLAGFRDAVLKHFGTVFDKVFEVGENAGEEELLCHLRSLCKISLTYPVVVDGTHDRLDTCAANFEQT